MTRSLEELYGAFLATGDEHALEQLMRRSSPALRALARRLGASADDADDLVQETIVAAIHGADRYDASRPLLPWLKGILTFRAAKLARETVRRRRGYTLPDGGAAADHDPALAAAQREFGDDVRAAIGSLPPLYQVPLQQYLLAGRSPVEIADVLGVQRATVRVRLHRGMVRLRELLRRWTSAVLLLLFGRTATARAAVVSAVAAGAVAIGAGAWLLRSEAIAPANTTDAPANAAATSRGAGGDREVDARVLREATLPLVDGAAVASLAVHVHGPDGAGLAGVGVAVEPAAGSDPVLHRLRAVTDANGVARWSGLAPRAVQVATDRGAAVLVEVRAGANEQRVLVNGGTTVTGRVVDATGEAVADAFVWLGSDTDGPWRGDDVVQTDTDGVFTLAHVPAGAFVAARHGTLARSDVQQLGSTKPIELRLGERGGAANVRVVDDAGAPIADALVFVGDAMDATPLWLAQGASPWRPPPFELRTDADGRAATHALAPGRHPVHVRAASRVPYAANVDIVRGEVTEHVVRLSRGAVVRGRVVSAEDGAPLANALAVFRTADPSHSIDVRTDAHGRFRFDCTAPGAGDVAAQAEGRVPRLVTITAAAGDDTELTIELPRTALVHGTLRRGDGQPTAGAFVRATWAPSMLLPTESTVRVGDDGTFRFTATGAGRVSLDVRLDGELLWRPAGAFTTWNGDAAAIVLPPDFAASGALHGTLRAAGGAPLAGARLFVHRDSAQWAEVGHTDDDGAFRLVLPAGAYVLFAETTSRALPTVNAGQHVVAAGAEVRVDFTAEPAGAVDVELVRADGQPIGDLALTVVGTQPRRRQALASEAKLRQALLPGDYTLHAMGSHVQWLDGLPFRVDTGRDTVLRIELPAATRCVLALQGLPRATGGAALLFTVHERWQRRWSQTFTLPWDAPLRLGAVLAAGDYEVEHDDAAGRSWHGTFAIAGDDDGARTIPVQLAPR